MTKFKRANYVGNAAGRRSERRAGGGSARQGWLLSAWPAALTDAATASAAADATYAPLAAGTLAAKLAAAGSEEEAGVCRGGPNQRVNKHSHRIC